MIWYRSALGVGIATLIYGGITLSILVAIYAVRNDGSAGLVVAAIVAAVCLPLLLTSFPLRYGLESDTLVIRSGVLRKRVPFRDIRRVQRTRDSGGSYAMSLDRIAVEYGPGYRVLISPIRPDEFATRLSQAAGLIREGGEWVRPSGSEVR